MADLKIKITVPANNVEVDLRDFTSALHTCRDFEILHEVARALYAGLGETLYEMRYPADVLPITTTKTQSAFVAAEMMRALDAALNAVAMNFVRYPLNEEEIAMVKDKTPIAAIKNIRTRLNLGLKEAKDAVDAWRAANGY